MLAEEHDQLEDIMKRLDLINRIIYEEKLHPKKHERPKSLGRATLPLIPRTLANVHAVSNMRRQTIDHAFGRPLPLPPLVIKKRKQPVHVAPD
jgi:hypothetical protein